MAVPALAAPDNEANTTRLDNTVRFLESAQNSDGGFSANGEPEEASNPDFTAWVAIALAAAGINPQDQSQPGGASAYSYLSRARGRTDRRPPTSSVCCWSSTPPAPRPGLRRCEPCTGDPWASQNSPKEALFERRRRRHTGGERHDLRDHRAQPNPGTGRPGSDQRCCGMAREQSARTRATAAGH